MIGTGYAMNCCNPYKREKTVVIINHDNIRQRPWFFTVPEWTEWYIGQIDAGYQYDFISEWYEATNAPKISMGGMKEIIS